MSGQACIKPAPRRPSFLVFAWNGLHGEADAERKWLPDPMAQAVSLYLTALSCDDLFRNSVPDATIQQHAEFIASAEGKADLVVVVPRDRDKPLSIEQLTVFHTGLGGQTKRVLYIHIAGHSIFSQGRINDWLFWISRPDGITNALAAWVREDTSHSSTLDSLIVRDYYISYCDKEQRQVDLHEPRWPSRTARDLIKHDSVAQFFLGLCRISSRFNRLEHDLNAQGGDRGTEIVAKKAFLDRCLDLHAAIVARSVVLSQRESGAIEALPRNVILLIDDHPERHGFDQQLATVVTRFLPGFQLWVWNTELSPHDSKFIGRFEVETFTAWSASDATRCVAIKHSPSFGTHSVPIDELLARTRVAMVDVLFQDAGGEDQEAGYGIIRGFHRLCRSRQAAVDTLRIKRAKAGEDPREWHLPGIIAISRASDLGKAQSAYRSGAGGYVLKERILGAAGVIASHLNPRYDFAGTLQSNFRLLHNLPGETVGLLRSRTIPRVSFHGSPPKDGDWARQQQVNTDEQGAQRIAPLLAALPKADIHVHPGSCMSPEFLVIASLVMLLRYHPVAPQPPRRGGYLPVMEACRLLDSLVFEGKALVLDGGELEVDENQPTKREVPLAAFADDTQFAASRVRGIANHMRKYLREQIQAGNENRTETRIDLAKERRYLRLRSILHKALRFPDHQDATKITTVLGHKQDAALFFFAVTHGAVDGERVKLPEEDLLRCFLLVLAVRGQSEVRVGVGGSEFPLRDLISAKLERDTWARFRQYFYESEESGSEAPLAAFGVEQMRQDCWRVPLKSDGTWITIDVSFGGVGGNEHWLANCPEPRKHPIAWLLASGTRSTNLREYLEGCEYSGAEHMMHPFLMHLFAQQALHQFVRQGVLYAELRTALSGYENAALGISFSDASACFAAAMGQAQRIVLQRYRKESADEPWLWVGRFALDKLFDPLRDNYAPYRFPCKISVVLTGKRHKSSRMLVREAGAGAVLHARPLTPAYTARDFVEKAISECRVVGFDLAGQEDEHPPHKFRTEYDQIARMHIPVTVHAGENAPADFVESAILDLRARRLGHGLALADDRLLMGRARDDGICIELCPVSNFQTNAVYPHGESGAGREYPLRTFLKFGLKVTINTDNPIISYTNMVKECFQASYAYGEPGLSLWDLLRILRAGFTQSFLTLPERHALLRLADQVLFDLFSKPQVVALLRSLPETAWDPRPLSA